jgi:hypothetical protein
MVPQTRTPYAPVAPLVWGHWKHEKTKSNIHKMKKEKTKKDPNQMRFELHVNGSTRFSIDNHSVTRDDFRGQDILCSLIIMYLWKTSNVLSLCYTTAIAAPAYII